MLNTTVECLYGECCGARYVHNWFYNVQYYCSMRLEFEPTILGLIVGGIILAFIIWYGIIRYLPIGE